MSYGERCHFLRAVLSDWRAKKLSAEAALTLLEGLIGEPDFQDMQIKRARALLANV